MSSNTTGSRGYAETLSTKRTDNNANLPFLTNVTSGCYVADVNLRQCILFHFRQKKPNSVAELMSIINGKATSSSFSGIVSGSPSSDFVPVKEDLDLLLDTHLSSNTENADDATVIKQAILLLYGVMDGV